MKRTLLFKGTLGLNNKQDPAKLRVDLESGLCELSETQNILVDNRQRPNRRFGQTKLVSGAFHSGFCDGGDAFVVSDETTYSAIYRVGTDYSLTGVVSGLTKTSKVSFCQIGEKTYWANGAERGVITNGVNAVWPVQTIGRTSNRDYRTPAFGTYLAFIDGRMAIATGSTIEFTERFKFGLVDRVRMTMQVRSTVRLLAPVRGGLFVSDEDYIYFFAGSNPQNFTEIRVAQYPAYAHSLACNKVEAMDIGFQEPGLCQIWSSVEGTCIGLPGGTMLNLTKQQVEYPSTESNAATLIWDGVFGIQSIVSTY